MPQPMSHAWHLVSQGEFNAAERIFQEHLNQWGDSADALRGMARVALQRGDAQQAEALARRGLSIDETADLQLLMGEILGSMGRRREAEQYLAHAVRYHSSDPYARVLLGEQKIRQGRWEEGTNDFIEALTEDTDGDAFRHAQLVVGDLIDAYIAGRIPEAEASKFINRLDYSVPKNGSQMQSFFAAARRAINSRSSMTFGQTTASQSLPVSIRSHEGSSSDGSSPAVSPSPASAPLNRSAAPQQAPAQQLRPSHAQEQRQESVPPRATGQRRSPGQPAAPEQMSGVDANQRDLQALIRRDRALNQDLVAGLAQMAPPEWPSEAGYDSIDTVPPISLDRGSVLGDSIGIDTRDFRLTEGDLLAEIFLERCLRQLLVATQKNKAATIVLRPESIWQIELNCRDGLLQDVQPLSPIYRERADYDDFRQLGLGAFIGECLVKTYDGTWTFQTPASQSYLEIGAKILKPFEAAARWMAAEEKEGVHLTALARQAKRASEASTAMTIATDYIDPTRELSDVALGAKLAELWAIYRFKLSDTAFSEVAETIEPISVDDDVILFKIGARWAPDFARGPQGSALLDDDTVALAYLRKTGEFVPLGSRKGFARLAEASFAELDSDSAGRALSWLVDYHRPGWWVASSDDAAARLSKRVGAKLNSPNIEHHRNGASLVVDGVSSEGPVRWRLMFAPNALVPWKLEVGKSGRA